MEAERLCQPGPQPELLAEGQAGLGSAGRQVRSGGCLPRRLSPERPDRPDGSAAPARFRQPEEAQRSRRRHPRHVRRLERPPPEQQAPAVRRRQFPPRAFACRRPGDDHQADLLRSGGEVRDTGARVELVVQSGSGQVAGL